MNKEDKNMQYIEWIREKWLETGGLISQAQASRICGYSRNHIKDLVKSGKITGYKFSDEAAMVSLAETLKIANERFKKCQHQKQEPQ